MMEKRFYLTGQAYVEKEIQKYISKLKINPEFKHPKEAGVYLKYLYDDLHCKIIEDKGFKVYGVHGLFKYQLGWIPKEDSNAVKTLIQKKRKPVLHGEGGTRKVVAENNTMVHEQYTTFYVTFE